MARLILVSNRLPVTVMMREGSVQTVSSAGGLATGLKEPHEQSNGLWIGWPGRTEHLSPALLGILEQQLAALGTVPVYLTDQEVDRFYEGYANGLLWPLFHYITGPMPLRVEGWREYRAVNERFASVVAKHYQHGDMIWVHDYQLMLVPQMLRERIPDARIGFFLHTPFPSSELFATLPQRRQIMLGMLGADLIGLHTSWYQCHFERSLERVLGVRSHNGRVGINGRCVQLGVFPIGVDAKKFNEAAATPEVDTEVARLRSEDTRLLVGIDRLDYTKGIPRRLLAFEELLNRRPEWRGKVRLIQVAVPSRTGVRAYKRFRQEVDAVVGRINGMFGTPHSVPVHYLYRSVDDERLIALYRAADAMLVTPIRDGMNLVAKEFIASRIDEDGVLVLSEFAGAAAHLREALLVNPYDVEHMADAYHAALTMEEHERRTRMRALRERVFAFDIHDWVKAFLAALSTS